MKVAIADIVVGKRMRKDYGNINELADSLERYGQIQPIVIDQDRNLIAGGRRLEAAIQLGWSEIDTVLKDDMDEISRRELELEENVKRKEFNWPEEVIGLAHLYKLRQDRHGVKTRAKYSEEDGVGYSLDDAAMEFDRSRGSIGADLELARSLKEFPELLDEKTKSSALKRLKVLKERKIRTEMASRTRPKAEEPAEPDGLLQSPPEQETEGGKAPSTQYRKAGFKGYGIVYFGDSRIISKHLPDDSIDCLVTDPPFALGMHTGDGPMGDRRLSSTVGSMYDDDPYKVLDVLDNVFAECARILKPDGHGYVFFHHRRYEDILTILERHFGEAVEPVPILWIKNTPGIGNPSKGWAYAYEPCFFINRGRAMMKPQAFNYILAPTVPPRTKVHPTEKPTALLRHIISASAVPGEVIFDPFSGSGSTLEAAVELGCRFVGCEADEGYYNQILERMQLAIGALQVKKAEGEADAAHSES